MAVVLWHLEISHYNEKVRWALAYKGIPHERRTPMPIFHKVRARMLTRGAHGRMPVLRIDDDRPIGDSTAIIAALEAYKPEPALYPADPEERRRALELEDYFDEEVAPRVRRLIWHYTLDNTAATIDAAMPSAGPLRKRSMRLVAPVAKALTRRDYSVNEAGAAEAVEGLGTAMDLIEREVGPEGYLVGDSFTVADLAGASLFTPLISPPGREYAPTSVPQALIPIRERFLAREGGAWVTEMYARHRGTRTLLPAAG